MRWMGFGAMMDTLTLAIAPRGNGGQPHAEATTPRPQRRAPDGWRTLRWAQQNAVGMDAEHLLRRYGIPVRSRYVSDDGSEAGCDVPERQAAWAEYLLCRAGWAVTSALVDARHTVLLDKAQRHGASRPVGGGRIRRQGLAAKLHGLLDELAGPGEATREKIQPQMESWKRTQATAQPVGGWMITILESIGIVRRGKTGQRKERY